MDDNNRLLLLLFVGQLGLPMVEVLAKQRRLWYERTLNRLIAAAGDAEDCLTSETPHSDRLLILMAGAVVRSRLLPRTTPMEETPCA